MSSVIISYGGSHFNSSHFRNVLKKYRTTAHCHPQANDDLKSKKEIGKLRRS